MQYQRVLTSEPGKLIPPPVDDCGCSWEGPNLPDEGMAVSPNPLLANAAVIASIECADRSAVVSVLVPPCAGTADVSLEDAAAEMALSVKYNKCELMVLTCFRCIEPTLN